MSFTPRHRWTGPWFGVALFGIWLVAVSLRFWGLGRFNDLVFDEVYFAKFAHHYLTQTPFFDAHPPLGKYLIAIAIGLAGYFPGIEQAPAHDLAGFTLIPWSYRWLNALCGSFVPLLVAGIAYQLNAHSPHRRIYSIVAGGLMTLDGLLLVESRYALLNVYLLLFGLLSHWCMLRSLTVLPSQRWLWQVATGISLGCAIAVKWNGLGFWLGLIMIWLFAKLSQWSQSGDAAVQRSILPQLGEYSVPSIAVYWIALPVIVYSLLWIPHLQFNPSGFWLLHQEMLGYHQRVSGGAGTHPYCSTWFTWPLMLRPVAYFYQTLTAGEPLPAWAEGLALNSLIQRSSSSVSTVALDVHAIGNPLLWWFSTVAMLLISLQLVFRLGHLFGRWLMMMPRAADPISCFGTGISSITTWTSGYLLVNYLANWLPWALVSRCLFLYHYMAAAIFALLAIAEIVTRWLLSRHQTRRIAGVGLLIGIAIAFLFWLPLYLGLPLSPDALQNRWWLKSWI